MSVTVATVAKKIAEALASSKSGRKFIGYTIGVTLFLVLLPLIVIVGLFGWMAGDGVTMLDRDQIISQLPIEQQEQIDVIDTTCDTIVTTFKIYSLPISDQRKAQAIYIDKLMGLESMDGFHESLVGCFMGVSANVSVYDLISGTFLVAFSDEEIARLDELYGITTPNRWNSSRQLQHERE